MRSRLFLLTLSVFTAVPAVAWTQAITTVSTQDFEIVESVPEATNYGEPGIARTQTAWIEMIKGAKQSIDIAAFYITDKLGSALSPVLDALIDRAGAGIRVHLLVDQSFLKNDHADVDRLRKVTGIEVRVLPVDTLTGVCCTPSIWLSTMRVFSLVARTGTGEPSNTFMKSARVFVMRALPKHFAAAFEFDWQIAEHPISRRLPRQPSERHRLLRQLPRIRSCSMQRAANLWSLSPPSVRRR